MANLQSAKKANRVAQRKAKYNQNLRDSYKKAIKQVMKAIEDKDLKRAEELLSEAYKRIDKAGKRFMHKNKAARKKSQISKAVKQLKIEEGALKA